MKPLRPFFMEDFLEGHRFQAKFNLGESGNRVRTTGDLLLGSRCSVSHGQASLWNMPLNDSPNWGREDLRTYIQKLHPQASMDGILVTTGTSEALFLLFRYLQPKKVALPIPAFQLLYEIPKALGATIIPLPVRWNASGFPFVDETEWIDLLYQEKPDCILINHPHNPSGLVFGADFLNEIHQAADTCQANLIGDEHYRFLATPHSPLGPTLFRPNGRTFVTGSFIKCTGTPGMRIGWCVGPHTALRHMQNEKNYTTHTVNPLSEWIAATVLEDLDSPLFIEIRKEWQENKMTLKNFLASSQTFYGATPEGGLVTAIGFSNTEDPKVEESKFKSFIDRGFFALPLSSMEVGASSFAKESHYGGIPLCGINRGHGLRIGLGCSTELFAKALKVIELS